MIMIGAGKRAAHTKAAEAGDKNKPPPSFEFGGYLKKKPLGNDLTESPMSNEAA